MKNSHMRNTNANHDILADSNLELKYASNNSSVVTWALILIVYEWLPSRLGVVTSRVYQLIE